MDFHPYRTYRDSQGDTVAGPVTCCGVEYAPQALAVHRSRCTTCPFGTGLSSLLDTSLGRGGGLGELGAGGGGEGQGPDESHPPASSPLSRVGAPGSGSGGAGAAGTSLVAPHGAAPHGWIGESKKDGIQSSGAEHGVDTLLWEAGDENGCGVVGGFTSYQLSGGGEAPGRGGGVGVRAADARGGSIRFLTSDVEGIDDALHGLSPFDAITPGGWASRYV
jgi:hypothetical protein